MSEGGGAFHQQLVTLILARFPFLQPTKERKENVEIRVLQDSQVEPSSQSTAAPDLLAVPHQCIYAKLSPLFFVGTGSSLDIYTLKVNEFHCEILIRR